LVDAGRKGLAEIQENSGGGGRRGGKEGMGKTYKAA